MMNIATIILIPLQLFAPNIKGRYLFCGLIAFQEYLSVLLHQESLFSLFFLANKATPLSEDTLLL
jgi:hypothetical protein